MASRVALFLTIASVALSVALPSWGGSSINTTQPANGFPYSPSPIRLNFGAAATDINALFSNSAGNSAPSNPSPGQWWLDTSGQTTYELKIWDGRGNAWLHVATLDTINNIWVPPVGGGLLPTILSGTTTNLGSVPQASLYVSGSNSIQSFGSSAPVGAIKFIIFTAGATLVNVPGQLSLPSGAGDVTQQAGDVAIALQVSQGNWQVIFDSRANGPTLTRTVLSGTQNLYVATTGTDASNNCTSNLSPCQTIQHAVNVGITSYDLGGQSLIISVANGTYPAGAAVSGPLVGSAAVPTPSIELPITGLQIVGNTSSPGAVIIADTSSPGFAPAAFASVGGANFTVSGFTVSSANGFGVTAQGGSILQYGNMIFGNTALPQVSSRSNSITNAIASYTVAGNSQAHLEAKNNAFAHISTLNPITITFAGSPTFSIGFVYSHNHSIAEINAGNTSFSGSIVGPQYLVQNSSTLSTDPNNSSSYLPGSIQGAVLDYSTYEPPMPITSFPGPTGIGSGGTVTGNPVDGAFTFAGSVDITAGTGASTTGTVTFAHPTHEKRICVASVGQNFWQPGATVSVRNPSADTTTFAWDNNGVALTNTVSYNLPYHCVGTQL